MPKPGQDISLREWSGKPYRSKQNVLAESVVIACWPCGVSEQGVSLDGRLMDAENTHRFAVADGFSGFDDMRAWFRENHGLPFNDGVVIYWR